MSSAAAAPATVRLPDAVRDALEGYREAHGGTVRLWARAAANGWVLVHPPGTDATAPGANAAAVAGGGVDMLVEALHDEPGPAVARSRFLSQMLEPLLRQDSEIRFFGRELAERYEEITLLYTISEILGSVISLREAAGTMLEEVVGTLGARRATLWVHDRDRGILDLVAAVGGEGQVGPIPVDEVGSITAKVFRDQRPVILGPDEEFPREVLGGRTHSPHRGSFLSVPVVYTPPEGESRTIGVINLVGRNSGDPFSAGDQKLIAAIASQVGAAVENSRLVAETLRQERLVREAELAHDLQMKLLPSVEPFREMGDVAVRCEAADSVGGDFYQLFRLPQGRLGVMVGDVSGHGFAAAMIMALTMSAASIQAAEGDPPAEVLQRLHAALSDELESTEMYLTFFYGVVDPLARQITYSSAGHPHAFRIGEGGAERLGATDLPLGLGPGIAFSEATLPWEPGRDLLFLFTDGLSDALGLGEIEGERLLLREIAAAGDLPLDGVVERLFALPGVGATAPADDRTALLVRI